MTEVVEVDATLVLNKRLQLRSVVGDLFFAQVNVFECNHPYVLVFSITATNISVRMDVQKDDLAHELKAWLEGKKIFNPALFASPKLEEKITKFVKFGKPPSQEDLFTWILSRSEIRWGDEADISFGGFFTPEDDNDLTHHTEQKFSSTNEFKDTVKAAMKNPSSSRFESSIFEHDEPTAKKSSNMTTLKIEGKDDVDVSSFSLTKQLLGRSRALSELKQSRVKGRVDAKTTNVLAIHDAEQYRIGADIEKVRHEIEGMMEERRKTIEVAKIRQQQVAERYRKVKESLRESKETGSWKAQALEELISLQITKEEIIKDIKKQKTKSQKAQQLLTWTMAPPGFTNHRGKWQRGIQIGPGPLPPSAISTLRGEMLLVSPTQSLSLFL